MSCPDRHFTSRHLAIVHRHLLVLKMAPLTAARCGPRLEQAIGGTAAVWSLSSIAV